MELVIPSTKCHPACFDSAGEYAAWRRLARASACGENDFCADCTAGRQHHMIESRRCAYPATTFSIVDGWVEGVRNQYHLTPWLPRRIDPAHYGPYECMVRDAHYLTNRLFLTWDGTQFIVPQPLTILKWRGLTQSGRNYMLTVYRGQKD